MSKQIRPKSVGQRPISRQFVLPNALRQSKLDEVESLLTTVNPRALAKFPPEGGNTALIKILFNIIKNFSSIHSKHFHKNTEMEILFRTQLKVLMQLYSHLTFLRRKNWIDC